MATEISILAKALPHGGAFYGRVALEVKREWKGDILCLAGSLESSGQ
ncbi:MAG: hypothetical protein L0Z68_05200 [Gammaproteobacteria bacterium]|nr:hypothetical protein [Gammaproteobacteria bacterium]